MRIGRLTRLAKLEGPRRDRAALRRELEELERRYAELSEEDIAAMSDEEMDRWFTLFAAEDGPLVRRAELRELLKTPQQRARDAKFRQWLDGLTDQQLADALAGRLTFPGDQS